MSKSSQAIFSALSILKKDEALRLQPDPDKSMRGLKPSVGRVASNNGLNIDSWTDENKTCLYVRQTT